MSNIPFILPKLPPKINYTHLIKEIGWAHNNLGKLNGLLINIPDPGLWKRKWGQIFIFDS